MVLFWSIRIHEEGQKGICIDVAKWNKNTLDIQRPF
jgi:hypothetical protein